MIKKIFILIAFVFLFSVFNIVSVSAASEKIVLLALDDFQVWWLEDVQEQIVQAHIDNSIPVTLGVIPSGIEDPWGAGDRIIERMKRWDGYGFVEVAQHGYDHEVYLEGMSYNNQYSRLKKGNDLMKSIGVSPNSFIPPFGSADNSTIKVLKELGFHTVYNPIEMEPTYDPGILIIQDQFHLCKNNEDGKNCVFKDYDTIVSEIDFKIQTWGVALVFYHMQDFESSNNNFDLSKANQIVDYANRLKQDGYTLMTVEQYYQYQSGACIPGTEVCDGIDNDCDGLIDEDYIETPTTCGIGICSNTGSLQCISGSEEDSCVPKTPVIEICDNQLDDDCDGFTDLDDSDCEIPVCTCKGDLNQDGLVDLDDIVILVNNLKSNPSDPGYKASPEDCADFNGDGEINLMDLFLLLVDLVATSDWSYSC